MQNKSIDEMTDIFIDMMMKYMDNRVRNFIVEDIYDDKNNRTFTVKYIAYNYFELKFNYDKGLINSYIRLGDRHINLNISQEWWEKTDLEQYIIELKNELELRIPDKYLKAKGWL